MILILDGRCWLMRECICGGCRNLKGVINNNGEVDEYKCKFGFPSDKCESCEEEEQSEVSSESCIGTCSETCSHFKADEEEDNRVTVICKGCGKELKKEFDDSSSGDVFCVSCYLSNMDK
jgi:hypothetical protein